MADLSQLIAPDAMNRALQDATRLGRVAFRRQRGFGRSLNYVALHGGHHFDSKALVAAAAAHMDPPIVLTSKNSWGGESTTAVLDACDVKWIDVNRLDEEVGPLTSSDYENDRSGSLRFWWANQGDNFKAAFEQGSLWASDFRANGQPAHEDWTALQNMQHGDVVFHYAKRTLRAISKVVQAATPASRPLGYGDATGYDDGWLVLVERLVVDMEIGLSSLQRVLSPGVGPMNRHGTPGRTYISPLPTGLGDKMARCLGLEPQRQKDSIFRPSVQELVSGHIPNSWQTDVLVTASRRAEQRYLRASLLSRDDVRCALCGGRFPPELLIAAHIKPRSQCTDTERLDFRAAAMLACTLGCDALFEHGYLAVDGGGVIRSADSDHPDMNDVLNRLSGNLCLAHSATTAANFQTHWRSIFRGRL